MKSRFYMRFLDFYMRIISDEYYLPFDLFVWVKYENNAISIDG